MLQRRKSAQEGANNVRRRRQNAAKIKAANKSKRSAKSRPHSSQSTLVAQLRTEIQELRAQHNEARATLHTNAGGEVDAMTRVMLSSIGDAILACDNHCRVIYLNPRAIQLLGWTLKAALGQPIRHVLQLIYEETRQPFEDICSKVLQNRRPDSRDSGCLLHTKTGQDMPIEYSAAPILDDAGNVTGVVLVLHDISAKHQADQALQASEARLRHVLDSITQGYYALDAEWRFVEVNLVAQRYFGRLAYELIGQEIWRIAHIPASTFFCQQFHQAVQEQRPLQFETASLIHTDTWLEVHLYPQAGLLHVYFRDISERKHVEEKLRQAKEELEQKVTERTNELSVTVQNLKAEVEHRQQAEQQLRTANEQLVERANLLRLLASELTLAEQRERRKIAAFLHDYLQQLLVAMGYRLSVLERKCPPLLKSDVVELVGILEQSLLASRSLTAQLSPAILQEGDLAAALQWLARWMEEKHGLTVELVSEGSLPPMSDDVRILLFESTRELLFNTVKHAQVKKATVELYQPQKNVLHLTVSDSGKGFSLDQLKLARAQGGGFGLFSIRERLEVIGGKFEIESTPGQGSRFTLTVPLSLPIPTDIQK